MAADARHSVTPNAAFQFDLMSLLSPSRPGNFLAMTRSVGDGRRGATRSNGEQLASHRTYPRSEHTVAG